MNSKYQSQMAATELKLLRFRDHKLSLMVSSILAGAYIGMGYVFSLVVKSEFTGSPAQGIMAALAFNIGLLLVFFAGADLFTGAVLGISLKLMAREERKAELLAIGGLIWLFNFLGAAIIAGLIRLGGVGGDSLGKLILLTVQTKINLSITDLVVRGIICNIFVCLAVWVAGGMKSESGKSIMSIAIITAFVSLGLEHVVANMLLFSYAGMVPEATQVAWLGSPINGLGLGILRSLFWVSLGNILGGWLFVGLPYHIIEKK